ncbi:hypothetical protein JCM5353_007718 [Sporobolomyces roseus]
MSTPRPSTSPHPPPHASTSYLPSTGQESEDPFLAQTAAIPLTERDRQEGYDVELLNARPRGAYSDGDGDSLTGRGEKFGQSPTPAGATTSGAESKGGITPVALPVGLGAAGIGAGSVGAATGAAGYGGGGGGTKEQYAVGEGIGGSRSSGTTARTGKRRPWFLRPLPLGLLAGFIVAVALAIGLGVGLSERSRHSHSSSVADVSGGLASGSGSRSRSRTRTGTATTGTVVPSSLYSSYTSQHPQSDESSSLSTSDPESTTELPTGESTTSIPSPASGTTLATTGNLPIPAGSATTISGSITVSRLSATEATGANNLVTITARARARSRRWSA